MLTLHIEAADLPDLVAKCRAALEVIPAPAAATDTPPPPPAAEKSVELPKPEPRATRVKKTATPPVSPEAPAASAAATPVTSPSLTPPAAVAAPVASVSSPAAPAAVPTVEELRQALGEVNELLGMAVCTALLGTYGAERVSLVPEDKRAACIAECKAKAKKQREFLAANAAAKATA